VIVNDRSGKLEPRKVWMGLGRNSADVDWCLWANSTRLLCSLSRTLAPEPYVAARYDPIVPAARLLAVDFDGGRQLMLVDKEWQSAQFEAKQNQLVSLTHADNDGVLVQMFTAPRYGRQTSRFRKDLTPTTVVYRLDIYTGELEERTRLDRFASYFADSDGEVRLAHVPKDNATVTYHYRLPGESKWRPWWNFQQGDFSNLFRPIQPIAGTSRFLATRQHEGRVGLWDLDISTMQAQLLSSPSQFDVEVAVHVPGGEVLGVEHAGDGPPQAGYFDARAREVIEAARYLHPDMSHAILDSAANDNVYLLRSSSDADAGTYRVLDLRNGPAPLEQIGTSYPELAAANLPRMTSIKYRARDGEMIPAFLTTPAAPVSTAGLVVLPHDGPADRTRWQFDYVRAFLVSRGYAVLQMNYRGSTGYGPAWEQAGFRQWDTLIRTDIADGARWAIEQRVVEPDRVCIAGFGFGGYQALLAAVREPELYRCAISVGAWTDLQHARSDADAFERSAMPTSNVARLRARSPSEHAEDIRIPVLLVHAELDAKVHVDQSIRMAKELNEACKPHELVVIPRADRELRWQSDRVELLSAIERFLASNLAAAPKPMDCD
jgi:dipeptidyl aminopeptidase/acylaminoacyl peptidase